MAFKYSIILPTYNERENISVIIYLIFEMAKTNDLDLDVVLIDDNSPDGTQDVVKQL